MECDSCGRYVPSADVLPSFDEDGRLTMACTRCRAAEGAERPTPSGVLPPLFTGRDQPLVGLIA